MLPAAARGPAVVQAAAEPLISVMNSRRSFDHQVGAAKQGKRYGKTKSLGGFQINDQFDFGGLLNWKIGRLFPLKNPAGVPPSRR
jgi:hypothetical protein